MGAQIKSVTFDFYIESQSTGNRSYIGQRRWYFPGTDAQSVTVEGQGCFSDASYATGYLVSSTMGLPWLPALTNSPFYLFTNTMDPYVVNGVQNLLTWNIKQYADAGLNLVFRLPDLGDHAVREMVLYPTMSSDIATNMEGGGQIRFFKDGVDIGLSGWSFSGRSFYDYFYGDYPISVIHSTQGLPWLFEVEGDYKVARLNLQTSYYRKNIEGSNPAEFDTIRTTLDFQYASPGQLFVNWLTVDDGGGESHIYTGDELDEDNPFIGGGTTEDQKPDPNFVGDDDGDNIIGDTPVTDDLPDETQMGASASGFATLFTPTKTQLKNLANLMWNHTFLETIRNLVENVSDLFVSLAMVPFVVPAGATKTVTWLGLDSGVSLTLASKQFLEFPMGSISLGGANNRAFAFDSCLDYSPFSHLGIYLPFIGYRDLDIDECRGSSIGLTYRIDILSGECVAIINVAGRDVYEFTGNCLSQIPISNENMQSLVSDAVNVGLAVAGFQAASGVAAAENAAAGVASKSELGDLRHAHAAAHMTHSDSQLASATANAMMGMKPKITKTGSVSGASAMMAVRQPYLVLTTPRQAVPENYERYCGFPANLTGRLGDFSGYTVVEDIRLNNLVATSAEVAEIYKLLKQGVII